MSNRLVLAAVAVVLGCGSSGEGEGDAPVPDAGREARREVGSDWRGDADGPDAADAADATQDLAIADARIDRMPPAPCTMPGCKRVVPGAATLVAYGMNASGFASCSHGDGSETWCAFSRPVVGRLGFTELWVINVTAASASDATVSCTASGDANCLLLSGNLFAGCTAHAFFGDTLVFYADSVGGGDLYRGVVRAWRPGMTTPQALTGPTGAGCTVTTSSGNGGPYGTCVENLIYDPPPARFDLMAGKVGGGAGPFVRQGNIVLPAGGGVRSYSWQFTGSNDHFVWSGRKSETEKEITYFKPAADLADGLPGTVLFDDGAATRIAFTGDGRKMFFFKNYTAGAGELYLQAFPPSGTATKLADAAVFAAGVPFEAPIFGALYGIPNPLGIAGTADKGLIYLENGNLVIARDTDNPGAKQVIATEVCEVNEISEKLDRVLFSRNCAGGRKSLHTVALDPVTGANAGGECKLSGNMALTLGPRMFTADGKWAYWLDKVAAVPAAHGAIRLLLGDGKLSNLETCTTTDTGKPNWLWFPVGDRGFVDSSDAADQSYVDNGVATLRVHDLRTGAPAQPAAPAIIQRDVDVMFAVPGPKAAMAVFTIFAGAPEVDGLWVYPLTPAGGP